MPEAAPLPAISHDHTPGPSLNGVAVSATLHCLLGCSIGEVLGLVIGLALGLGNANAVVLAVVLAFTFGDGLTLRPLMAAGVPLRQALGVAFASDTLSIGVMEIVDNAVVLAIPGAMDAGLPDPLFRASLILGLGLAFVAAFPVNLWLIRRGRGHALVHRHAHGTPH